MEEKGKSYEERGKSHEELQRVSPGQLEGYRWGKLWVGPVWGRGLDRAWFALDSSEMPFRHQMEMSGTFFHFIGFEFLFLHRSQHCIGMLFAFNAVACVIENLMLGLS